MVDVALDITSICQSNVAQSHCVIVFADVSSAAAPDGACHYASHALLRASSTNAP